MFVIFQAIENLKNEMSLLNDVESYCVTMDDIIQTNIHDIGFQYDDAGNELQIYFGSIMVIILQTQPSGA